jgi:hypothetical protein
VRTKSLLWPLGSSAFQTTWTPVPSAVTCGKVLKTGRSGRWRRRTGRPRSCRARRHPWAELLDVERQERRDELRGARTSFPRPWIARARAAVAQPWRRCGTSCTRCRRAHGEVGEGGDVARRPVLTFAPRTRP